MDIATKNALRFALTGIAIIVAGLIIQVVGGFFIGNEIVHQPYYYCAIIWFLFAENMAKFEAHYWLLKSESKRVIKINEHVLLTFIRAIVIIPIWIATDWKAVLCYVFMFPFVHDGSYYSTRERLVKGTYPKKWFAQSTTSTAFSTRFFVLWVRVTLFAIALFTLIILRYRYV